MKEVLKTIRKRKYQLFAAVVVYILLNYLCFYFRVTVAGNFMFGFNALFSNPLYLLYAFPLSINTLDLTIPLFIMLCGMLIILDRRDNKKHYMKGSEYGSAKWGNPEKDIKGMYDKEKVYNNILFSKRLKLMLDDSEAPFELRRNKNVVVFGGSGSGKTRFVVKPNLLQMNASFVTTDPKGTIVNEVGYALKKIANYKIKILNTVNFAKSMRYNPLHYVKDEKDILKLVETIIANTTGEGEKRNEDFWVKAEKLLYQAYLSLIVSKFPKEERHLGTLVDLLEYSTVKENDEDFKNPIDYLFEELEKEDSTHFAVKQYKLYKKAAGKTAKSILISCGARLSPLNIPSLRDLISKDELALDTLGDKGRKTALFVIVPDTDDTFNFIVSIMYSQLFNMLCTIADDKYMGELPTPVRFILDEFANIGVIPKFEKLIATIRSRNISATIILQTLSQLKSIYKEKADTIIGNCDTSIFLGGKEGGTIKQLNEELGKQTIDDYNRSETRSNANSVAQQHSKLARDLMTKDELLRMPRDKCVVQVIGLRPFLDNKYDLTKHPRYKYHAKSRGGKYWFDIDKYLKAVRNPQRGSKGSGGPKIAATQIDAKTGKESMIDAA